MKTQGIHHITAIVGDPQENVDFYAGVLAMRFIKQTVNFDDPETYHLYFGNESGDPGTAMTFFPWPKAYRGQIGGGQVGVTQFAVPEGALDFWRKRLASKGVAFEEKQRFDETAIAFTDPHGLRLELVERADGEPSRYATDGVDSDVAIKGFAGATLYSTSPEKTNQTMIDVLGFQQTDEDDERVRFRAPGPLGSVVDVMKKAMSRGTMGVGTVHHIAYRAEDDDAHAAFRARVQESGFRVTPFIDRQYFRSIYFREYGEVLFEIATDEPGFTVDEPFETLGESLMLPPQHERLRNILKGSLKPIDVEKHRGRLQ